MHAVQAGGPGLKALTLTKEHLAIHAAERQRISAAGGFVSKDGRLNGRIQVSRSFGDAQFKRSGATAAPDMQVFDAQGAVAMVQQLLSEGRDPKAITNRLINAAVRERRCKDNCTIMLLVFGSSSEGGAAAQQLAPVAETSAAADGQMPAAAVT
ncbi:hypothetical protein MNEG_4366 [Monoraphidium neglectum]|uniref:PPM-type phosphatase domain-containing protein n=1 Tax=Monoraphidium neglectum TaxID=145388 RepID=A0A0D2MT25_9CHLO|nr:hypothetical protein MNEG_4366 [Monoraphidium neglectum]KIZ03592.1 hypothetical protein MNEG_4366 [Monoraphidium neglectum]|eukprot:XP_013902611.1 hypothetical protein MNEG_4366 [Monoraphidium neglectum]